MLIGLFVALFVVLLDQFSKNYVYEVVLAEVNKIEYSEFFNFIKAWNKGVSFSMFDGYGVWSVVGLSAFAILIVLFILYLLSKEKNRIIQVSYGFIIGGAIGNVIDRVRFGAVFDFIDVYYGAYHWPTFNLADSFICVGAFMIIFYSMFFDKKKRG